MKFIQIADCTVEMSITTQMSFALEISFSPVAEWRIILHIIKIWLPFINTFLRRQTQQKQLLTAPSGNKAAFSVYDWFSEI